MNRRSEESSEILHKLKKHNKKQDILKSKFISNNENKILESEDTAEIFEKNRTSGTEYKTVNDKQNSELQESRDIRKIDINNQTLSIDMNTKKHLPSSAWTSSVISNKKNENLKYEKKIYKVENNNNFSMIKSKQTIENKIFYKNNPNQIDILKGNDAFKNKISRIKYFDSKKTFNKNIPKKTNKQMNYINSINSHGCKHYKKKCLSEFKCCSKLYECRRCHDKMEDHRCNRNEIDLICLICLKKQSFSQKCIFCQTIFAKYSCEICSLLTDDERTYHCKDCNVCRKGNQKDFFHCMQCNACLPIETMENHLNETSTSFHVENTLSSHCPICAQDLFYSTSFVVLMHCGHSIHKKCFISYKNKSFQCPVCLKSSSNQKTVNKRIDYILSKCVDLNNQKNINLYECVTSCFDCQATFTSKYTYLYNKCQGCGSYNTRINELYKREE